MKEYFAMEERRIRAKAALDAIVRDPTVPAEEKHHAAATYHVTAGRHIHNCRDCWLMRGLCVCDLLCKVPSARLEPHGVVAYLHHFEWGRGSSTGNLIRACLGGELFVTGERTHERALREMFEGNDGGKNVAILWPGEGSVDVRDVVREASRRSAEALGAGEGNAGEGSVGVGVGGGGGVTFVAVDATWNSARKMMRRIPKHITRARIPPEAFDADYDASKHVASPPPPPPSDAATTKTGSTKTTSLLAPVRKYKNAPDGRCSTFEAVIALMRVLGHDRETCDGLLRAVKTKVDAVLVQKSVPGAYGTFSVEEDVYEAAAAARRAREAMAVGPARGDGGGGGGGEGGDPGVEGGVEGGCWMTAAMAGLKT